MANADDHRRAAELADRATPFVAVTLVGASGSTPADAGAKMLVTESGLDYGTIGGGRVEAKAIETARVMLRDRAPHQLVDWSLKADVGMTCGGRVQLYFEATGLSDWPIAIFGAGHVSQALTRVLVTLPCQVTCIDPRKEWLARLPNGVATIAASNPPDEVAGLPDHAFVLCMTRGHAADLPVLERLFASQREFPYVGVIGSKAKAAVLRKELTAAGVAADRQRFHCPIGLQLGSNQPAEIAISIAAQLLAERDRIAADASAATT